MAMMEHYCQACGHAWFDNVAYVGSCQKCGSTEVYSYADEDPDYDYDEDPEYPEER